MKRLLKITTPLLLAVLFFAVFINASTQVPVSTAPSNPRQLQVSTRTVGPPPSFSKTFGGSSSDYFFDIIECSSGGYAMVGYTWSFGEGNNDMYLVRVNADGNLLWNKTYGGTGQDFAYGIVELSNGFALAGGSDSYSADANAWLVRTDLNGNHLWNASIGGPSTDRAYGLVACASGGFTMAGQTESFGADSADLWLLHTDATGNHLWNKTFGYSGYDYGRDLVECTGGGYALCGYVYNYGAGLNDFWLIRTDISGNHLWNKTFGGANHDRCYSIVECSSSGFALAGSTWSYGVSSGAAWLVRTDSSGNHQWNKTYDGFGQDLANGLIEYSDGGFALAGYQQHPYTLTSGTPQRSPQPYDGLLLRTDSSGNQLWNTTYGLSGQYDEDIYRCLLEDSNGDILTAGSTESWGAGQKDAWLVKTRHPIVWDPAPADQTLAFGATLSYDLNVTSWFTLDAWTINDTTNFAISTTGLVSNALALTTGVYGIRVTVTDVLDSELIGEFTVTVEVPFISPIPLIAVAAVIIIVVIIILLYFFVFRKKK